MFFKKQKGFTPLEVNVNTSCSGREKKLLTGFTIIELIVVIAIIAILAAIVLVSVQGNIDRAKKAKTQAEVSEIAKALLAYKAEKGCYPDPADGTCCIPSTAGCGTYGEGNWNNVRSVLVAAGLIGGNGFTTDAWGNAYYYFAEWDDSGAGGSSICTSIWSIGSDKTDDSDSEGSCPYFNSEEDIGAIVEMK